MRTGRRPHPVFPPSGGRPARRGPPRGLPGRRVPPRPARPAASCPAAVFLPGGGRDFLSGRERAQHPGRRLHIARRHFTFAIRRFTPVRSGARPGLPEPHLLHLHPRPLQRRAHIVPRIPQQRRRQGARVRQDPREHAGSRHQPLIIPTHHHHPAAAIGLAHHHRPLPRVQRRRVDPRRNQPRGSQPAPAHRDEHPLRRRPSRHRQVQRHGLEAQAGGDLGGRARLGRRGHLPGHQRCVDEVRHLVAVGVKDETADLEERGQVTGNGGGRRLRYHVLGHADTPRGRKPRGEGYRAGRRPTPACRPVRSAAGRRRKYPGSGSPTGDIPRPSSSASAALSHYPTAPTRPEPIAERFRPAHAHDPRRAGAPGPLAAIANRIAASASNTSHSTSTKIAPPTPNRSQVSLVQ